MLGSAVKKVMWVGRATVFLVGLAVILAVVFGVVSRATAHDGSAGLFHLGHNNLTTALTTLTGNVNGSAMRVLNNNAGTDDTALDLSVQSGEAPMKVNSAKKVSNLNADRLDNLDSRALGVTTKTSHEKTSECDTNLDGVNDCAVVAVNVPAGKQYHVTVFSSFTAESATTTLLTYCPMVQGSGVNTCLGITNVIDMAAGYAESGASSGDIILGPGTYNVSTNISPEAALSSGDFLDATTTVQVTDTSAPGPPIN